MSTLAPENLKKLEVPILKSSSNPSLWNFTESFVQVIKFLIALDMHFTKTVARSQISHILYEIYNFNDKS